MVRRGTSGVASEFGRGAVLALESGVHGLHVGPASGEESHDQEDEDDAKRYSRRQAPTASHPRACEWQLRHIDAPSARIDVRALAS
jgi:hypothetical protein